MDNFAQFFFGYAALIQVISFAVLPDFIRVAAGIFCADKRYANWQPIGKNFLFILTAHAIRPGLTFFAVAISKWFGFTGFDLFVSAFKPDSKPLTRHQQPETQNRILTFIKNKND